MLISSLGNSDYTVHTFNTLLLADASPFLLDCLNKQHEHKRIILQPPCWLYCVSWQPQFRTGGLC